MDPKANIAPVRILPDDVANKIAAGEVVERPASVVKELLENALDAGATRISVRVVAAGRRLIEVTDNGHGMSEQNALLAIERHATSKIRNAADLEGVKTMGFRGEALASVASVSRFELVTRRAKDESATRLRVDGGMLRDVEQVGAPVGTRVTVNRLYFNTPVRAKFLKGITTELGHCIDAVQRHCLARSGVGFQFTHNDKVLLDVPEHANLAERVALIWGLSFAKDMVELEGEQAGFRLRGVIGQPGLTRAQRSHQFFFMNGRPVNNRSLQYGFEDGYRGLVTIGRHPVGIVLLETHPRFVDVNIHPTKREIRFRDERAARDAIRDVVRRQLSEIMAQPGPPPPTPPEMTITDVIPGSNSSPAPSVGESTSPVPMPPSPPAPSPAKFPADSPETEAQATLGGDIPPREPFPQPTRNLAELLAGVDSSPADARVPEAQEELPGIPPRASAAPSAVYEPVGRLGDAPLQIFDTYLLVPSDDRLLIIDQHALHERLNYDSLVKELEDHGYQSQQLTVPVVIEVAPSQVKLVERNIELFAKLGVDIEPFGGNTFQISGICHLYEESNVTDFIFHVLDELAQGDLFDRENFMADILRLATRACKASVRAGDRLTPQERQGLLEGFGRLRPPYTCPHGRPIITELTQRQKENSFRRIQ